MPKKSLSRASRIKAKTSKHLLIWYNAIQPYLLIVMQLRMFLKIKFVQGGIRIMGLQLRVVYFQLGQGGGRVKIKMFPGGGRGI